MPEPVADGRAYMDAPPAPSAEEWAQAATYRLKNSKRYRYTWSQQVRSMMGRAYEGADQGAVRFRVEIAPNGTLAKLDTLCPHRPRRRNWLAKPWPICRPYPPRPQVCHWCLKKPSLFSPSPPMYPP
ncbi:hypothetical protein RZS08_13295, partial [Arthrospira platensis SPKY1]|nr:hypothetical protein [Arthrospira platensis SPKY1]